MVIKKRIVNIKGINVLDLSNLKLSEIPKSVFNVRNLNFLYLSGNYLKTIPESIKSLTNLYLLDLSNNGISLLADSIFELSNLRELNVKNNRIEIIPKIINRAKELRRLYLNSNMIKELPNSICDLKHLKWLYLNDNPIVFLPDCLTDNSNLEIRIDDSVFLEKNYLIGSNGVKFDKYENLMFLDYYHRYWNYYPHKHKNPAFNSFGDMILNLKKLYSSAIDYFYDTVNEKLQEKIHICAVPPSECGRENSGIYMLIDKLTENNTRINCLSCLVRYTTVEPSHGNKNRSMEKHLNSIRINNIDLIKNKKVLLIDDVYTTGNSIKACKKILIEKGGARFIQPLVLGKTAKEKEE